MDIEQIIKHEQEKDYLFDDLKMKLSAREAYRKILADCEAEYKLALRAAYVGGVSMDVLRDVTGLTRQRIYQTITEAEALLFRAATDS